MRNPIIFNRQAKRLRQSIFWIYSRNRRSEDSAGSSVGVNFTSRSFRNFFDYFFSSGSLVVRKLPIMESVLAYLESNKGRFQEELCDYVRFPSVSAQPQHKNDLAACADWLLRHCQNIGLDGRLCPTAGNPVIIAKTP